MREARAAYATFEKTILEYYERKLLTLNLLDRVASQYRFTQIDSSGSQHLRSEDDKDLIQICIELARPSFPIVSRGSGDDNEEYWEQELRTWEEIVHTRWNWRAYCAVFPVESPRDKVA